MDLARVAPAFVEMAHRIVWATVATVDPEGRPRTRILHPIWEWDGASLVGWIATDPTSPKAAHLAGNPGRRQPASPASGSSCGGCGCNRLRCC